MDNLGSLHGSKNTTVSGVLGARELRNNFMMYSVNASSFTLRGANLFKVEAKLQPF